MHTYMQLVDACLGMQFYVTYNYGTRYPNEYDFTYIDDIYNAINKIYI